MTLFGHQENLTLVSYVPKKGKSDTLLSRRPYAQRCSGIKP